jgi:iron complex outermembrane receptor protein
MLRIVGGWIWCVALVGAALGLGAANATAAPPDQPTAETLEEPASDDRALEDLMGLEFDELMGLEVTLLSRRAEPRFEAPAASYVITQEQIRRSAMTRIPDLLRLVPGMQVGKVSANNWSIVSRSDPTLFNPRMLVQMDGRTLYTPLFGGVYWGVQDTLLQDIERIEVIRGPGSSLWGSNAVNGIVNIVTKSARDTQGALGYVRGGIGDALIDGGGRFGTQVAENAFLRLYAKARRSDTGAYLSSDESTNDGFFPVGDDADDDGRQFQGGFRFDWDLTDADHLTFQGDGYVGTYRDVFLSRGQAVENEVDASGANLLTRWAHTFSPTSSSVLHLYWDYTNRVDESLEEKCHTFDMDWQHGFALPRQQLSWGAGVRVSIDDIQDVGVISVEPASRTLALYSLFIQDRISLLEHLDLILGTKWEHNDFTGSEFQPSGRLLWVPNPSNTLWLAVTRSVRIPSRLEADGALTVPPFRRFGDESVAPRTLSYEAGYRVDLFQRAMLEADFFYDDYNDPESVAEATRTANDWVWGVEVSGRLWLPHRVRLEASYTYREGEHVRDDDKGPGVMLVQDDLTGMARNMARLGLKWDVTGELEFDADLFFVGETEDLDNDIEVPAYARVDVGLRWRPMPGLELALVGTNLQDDAHPEDTTLSRINTGVKRGALFSVSYEYK